MPKMNIVEFLKSVTLGEWAGAVVLLSVLVQITPIKINPWSWIARKVGKAINHDLLAKVDGIGSDVKGLRAEVDKNAAKLAREKILEFGDDLIYQPERRHSKDRFDDVVQHITEYEAYCAAHPEFKNHMTETTEKLILGTYEKCMKEHTFL